MPAEGAQECGAPPAEDEPRTILELGSEKPVSATGSEGTSTSEGSSSPLGVVGGTRASTTPAAGGHALRIDGLTLSPLGVLSPALRFHGDWRRRREPDAWQGTVMAGAKGATLTVELPPGRAAFILTGTRAAAVVQLRSAGRTTIYKLHGSSDQATRLLLGRRRPRRGLVTLRVAAGTVDVDGVAVTP